MQDTVLCASKHSRKYCELQIFSLSVDEETIQWLGPTQAIQVPLYHKRPLSHTLKLQPLRCQRWIGHLELRSTCPLRASPVTPPPLLLPNVPWCLKVLMQTGSCLGAGACQRVDHKFLASNESIFLPPLPSLLWFILTSTLSWQRLSDSVSANCTRVDPRKEHGGPADQRCGSESGKMTECHKCIMLPSGAVVNIRILIIIPSLF